MTDTDRPWWRDAKFLIPGILIPVLLAFLPFILPEKISKHLEVNIELQDPRRADPFSYLYIKETFNVQDLSIDTVGAELSSKITEKVKSFVPLNPEERERMDVSLYQQEDGTFFLKEPFHKKIAVHLTRFPEVNSLWDLLNAEHPSAFIQMTMEESRLITVRHQRETPVTDIHMTAGVYRVVLTSPGYHDRFYYLELTGTGELNKSDSSAHISEAQFPLMFSLYPRHGNSGNLIVALKPISSCTELSSRKPLFDDIKGAIQASVQKELRVSGFSLFLKQPEIRLDFHPYRLKNMEPPQGHKFADFIIRVDCRWVK
jgi:hypothetical protein